MSNTNVKSLCDEFLSDSNNEAMLKCVNKLQSLLRNNDKLQKDIFINISDRGLTKILTLIKDGSPELRKSLAKFLIDMIYGNEVLQNIFCEKFNFTPIGTVICVNWFPKHLKDVIKIDEKLILDIKASLNSPQKLRYWMYPFNSDYNDEVIPDPQKYLIGFYYTSNANVTNFKIRIIPTMIKTHMNLMIQDPL